MFFVIIVILGKSQSKVYLRTYQGTPFELILGTRSFFLEQVRHFFFFVISFSQYGHTIGLFRFLLFRERFSFFPHTFFFATLVYISFFHIFFLVTYLPFFVDSWTFCVHSFLHQLVVCKISFVDYSLDFLQLTSFFFLSFFYYLFSFLAMGTAGADDRGGGRGARGRRCSPRRRDGAHGGRAGGARGGGEAPCREGGGR